MRLHDGLLSFCQLRCRNLQSQFLDYRLDTFQPQPSITNPRCLSVAVIFKFEFGVSKSASGSNRQSDFSGRFNCRLEFRPVLEMPYTKQFLVVMLRYLTIVP